MSPVLLQHLQLTPTLSLLPLLLLILLLLYAVVATILVSRRNNLLPPSPWRLPLIGNLHQLAGPLPHRSLRRLSARHGPLMLLRLGRVPTLIVSSAAAPREIMQTQDAVFASRPSLKVPTQLLYGCTDVAFAPHGDYWRRARKACVRHLLSPKQVRSYRLEREQEVHHMIQSITDHHHPNSPTASYAVPAPPSSSGDHDQAAMIIDLSEVLSSFAKDVVGRIVLGRCRRDDDEGWSHAVVDVLVEECNELLGRFHVGDYFPFLAWWGSINGLDKRVREAFRRIDGILEEVVAGRRREVIMSGNNGGCFVDVLLGLHNCDHTRGGEGEGEGEGEFSFSMDNIKALVEDLFGAGTDSTIIVLEWAMAELIRNNKAMERLQNELRGSIHYTKTMIKEDDLIKMSYLKAVIKETMRLHPPGPLLVPRELMQGTQLHGYNIPSKTRVIINAWAICRDPESWANPEEFRPERFIGSSLDFRGRDFELIPFGAGRRICPGINFAASIVELALANLVYCFDWRLPEGMTSEEIDMDEAPGITSRKRVSLRLVATPRSY